MSTSGARWCPTSSALLEEPELRSNIARTESPNCLHSRPEFDEEPRPRGGGSFRVIVATNCVGAHTVIGPCRIRVRSQKFFTGPVAQRIEQQPSKLKVAGSIPAGVAIPNSYKLLYFNRFSYRVECLSMPANWDESEQNGSNAHECGAKTHEKPHDSLPFRSARLSRIMARSNSANTPIIETSPCRPASSSEVFRRMGRLRIR